MNIEQMVEYLIHNYGWISLVMVFLVTGILQLIKLPVKCLTKKIKNEALRKLINKVFILMAFGLAFGLYYLGSKILPQFISYSSLESVVIGAFSIVVYALGEGIIKKNSAKALSTVIKEITEDGEITKEEVKTAYQKFQEELKK